MESGFFIPGVCTVSKHIKRILLISQLVDQGRVCSRERCPHTLTLRMYEATVAFLKCETPRGPCIGLSFTSSYLT